MKSSIFVNIVMVEIRCLFMAILKMVELVYNYKPFSIKLRNKKSIHSFFFLIETIRHCELWS